MAIGELSFWSSTAEHLGRRPSQRKATVGFETQRPKRATACAVTLCFLWLRGLDLNQRPLGYEPNELPGCSTPQVQFSNSAGRGQICRVLRCRLIRYTSWQSHSAFQDCLKRPSF